MIRKTSATEKNSYANARKRQNKLANIEGNCRLIWMLILPITASVLMKPWQAFVFSFAVGDADGVIRGANQITRKVGGTVKYESVEEFKTFIDDEEEDLF